LRCVIPVVCRINQTIGYMCISSNTTIDWLVCCLLYVKHNYMFRPQMLAIFRLYKENLSISYTCICRGCVGCRAEVYVRDLACSGYRWFLTNPKPRPLPSTLARSRTYTSPLHSTHPLQMHV